MSLAKHLSVSVLMALLTPAAAMAADTEFSPVSGDMLEALLTGNTIKGEYRFLRARTDTFNFSEQHNPDGTTLYTEGNLKTRGSWYILRSPEGFDIGDKICYRYAGDNLGSGPHCFWVYQEKSCYYSYGLENIGLNGPRSYNNWTARWIIKGSGGTCALPIS